MSEPTFSSVTTSSKLHVLFHKDARQLLSLTQHDMESYESQANMVYSYALSRAGGPENVMQLPEDVVAELVSREEVHETSEEDPVRFASTSTQPRDFWLSVWSSFPSEAKSHLTVKLDAILSCPDNSPLFLFFNGPSDNVDDSFVLPRMRLLASKLYTLAPVTRMYACFGPSAIVSTFSRVWSSLAGMPICAEPFYSAFYTSCTKATFTYGPPVFMAGHRLQQLDNIHLAEAAELCRGFSSTTVFYQRSLKQAYEEARQLVYHKQLWGYFVHDTLTSIVALTRRTPSVAAISKVYTVSTHRRHGYAEILLREVCRFALIRLSKIVLFVAKENISAMNLYGRVGFIGVGPRAGVPGEQDLVEEWMEIGFQGANSGLW